MLPVLLKLLQIHLNGLPEVIRLGGAWREIRIGLDLWITATLVIARIITTLIAALIIVLGCHLLFWGILATVGLRAVFFIQKLAVINVDLLHFILHCVKLLQRPVLFVH